MGRKQKIKQARHELKKGSSRPRAEVQPRARGNRAWLLLVLGVLLALTAAAVLLFVQHRAELFQAALQAQAYEIDQQLQAHRDRFTSEDTQRLENLLQEVQTLNRLPNLDARAAGQLKFILGVLDEIVKAGGLEAGELGKLEAQLQAAREYLNRQEHPRRP